MTRNELGELPEAHCARGALRGVAPMPCNLSLSCKAWARVDQASRIRVFRTRSDSWLSNVEEGP